MAAKPWDLTIPSNSRLKSQIPGDIRDVKEHAQVGAGFYCEQQPTPDRTVSIYEGVAWFGGDLLEYVGNDDVDLGPSGAFETTAVTADYYNEALFSINSGGTLNMTEGTAAATPGAVTRPDSPSGQLPIAIIMFQDDGTGTAGTILTIEQDEITQIHALHNMPSLPSDLVLDPTPDTDHAASGVKATMTVDVNGYGYGAALFIASDGNLETAQADSVTTMPCTAMAIESGTGSKEVIFMGIVRDDTWAWTPGTTLFVSAGTAGAITDTMPTDPGNQVQIIGIATHADRILFNPSQVIVEL